MRHKEIGICYLESGEKAVKKYVSECSQILNLGNTSNQLLLLCSRIIFKELNEVMITISQQVRNFSKDIKII